MKHSSPADYTDAVARMAEGDLTSHMLEQAYFLAHTTERKYRAGRWAFVLVGSEAFVLTVAEVLLRLHA